MRVVCEIDIYEEDDYCSDGRERQLRVSNHGDRKDWVILELAGDKIVVNAADLRAAIDNATNRG